MTDQQLEERIRRNLRELADSARVDAEPLATVEDRMPRRRWLVPAVAASVAAALVIAVVVVLVLRDSESPTVTAGAGLTPMADAELPVYELREVPEGFEASPPGGTLEGAVRGVCRTYTPVANVYRCDDVVASSSVDYVTEGGDISLGVLTMTGQNRTFLEAFPSEGGVVSPMEVRGKPGREYSTSMGHVLEWEESDNVTVAVAAFSNQLGRDPGPEAESVDLVALADLVVASTPQQASVPLVVDEASIGEVTIYIAVGAVGGDTCMTAYPHEPVCLPVDTSLPLDTIGRPRDVTTVGSVTRSAAEVVIDYGDGSTVPADLVGSELGLPVQFYVDEIGLEGPAPTVVTAFDADGNLIAQVGKPGEPEHLIAEGEGWRFTAKLEDGELCSNFEITEGSRRQGFGSCSVGSAPSGLDINRGDGFVYGSATPETSQIRVQFDDGTAQAVDTIALAEIPGRVFFVVPREDASPLQVEALDASGVVIDSMNLKLEAPDPVTPSESGSSTSAESGQVESQVVPARPTP